MKKVSLLSVFVVLLGAMSVFLMNCTEEETPPAAFELVTLMAGDADLNGATSASGVANNASIVAVFTVAVDTSTANASNIILLNTTENQAVTLDIAVNGNTVTITPEGGLRAGAAFAITFGLGLKSTEGVALTQTINRTFSADGILVPDGQVAYWNFDNSDATDAQGNNDASAEIAMTYVDGRSTKAGKAAKFDGDASIIEIPNGDQLINAENFTISFWMKTESAGHVNADGNPAGHFVIGLGAFYGLQFEVFGGYDGAKFAIQYAATDADGEDITVGEDMWFPSNATDASTGGWQGWDFAKVVTPTDMAALYLKDVWTQVVYTYDGAEKKGTLYYNGEKMKSFDFDLWPAGDNKTRVTGLKYGGKTPDVVNELAFGFIHSRAGTMWDSEPWGGYDNAGANHFKGQLDDIRIFHAALSETQVSTLYNNEKP